MSFCLVRECRLIPKMVFNAINQIHITCPCTYDKKVPLHLYLNIKKVKELPSNQIQINEPEIREIQLKLEQSKNYLNSTLQNIKKIVSNSAIERVNQIISQKNEEIKELINTLITELNSAESSYENCLKRNDDIISLLKKMLCNYSTNPHPQTKENLIKNSNFVFPKCNENDSLKDFTTSLDCYSIISTSPNDLIEISTIRTNSQINQLLLLKDKRLAVNFNNELKIYNIDNDYKCDATITGEFKTICQLDDGNIATYYRQIKIWDIRTYQCIFSTYCSNLGENGNILNISQNRIALSTGTTQIKNNFDIDNPPYIVKIYTPYHDIPNEVFQIDSKIESMLYMNNKNYLVLFLEEEISIWDMSTYSNVMTLNRLYNNEMKTVPYILDENRIIIGGTHCSILDVNNRTILPMNVDNISYYSSFIKLRGNEILFGFHNGELRKIDLTNKEMKIMKTQQQGDIVNILKINNNVFCTTSAKGTIAFLKYPLLG